MKDHQHHRGTAARLRHLHPARGRCCSAPATGGGRPRRRTRGPSDFLDALREHCEAGHGEVEHWADEPGDEEAEPGAGTRRGARLAAAARPGRRWPAAGRPPTTVLELLEAARCPGRRGRRRRRTGPAAGAPPARRVLGPRPGRAGGRAAAGPADRAGRAAAGVAHRHPADAAGRRPGRLRPGAGPADAPAAAARRPPRHPLPRLGGVALRANCRCCSARTNCPAWSPTGAEIADEQDLDATQGRLPAHPVRRPHPAPGGGAVPAGAGRPGGPRPDRRRLPDTGGRRRPAALRDRRLEDPAAPAPPTRSSSPSTASPGRSSTGCRRSGSTPPSSTSAPARSSARPDLPGRAELERLLREGPGGPAGEPAAGGPGRSGRWRSGRLAQNRTADPDRLVV